MDTSTTNELAGGVKYYQEERAGAGHAFSLLRDYLKLAEGADFNLKSPFKAIVRFGIPYVKITDLQKSLHARLIMLASHSHTLVGRLLMGSNTDYLIHLV